MRLDKLVSGECDPGQGVAPREEDAALANVLVRLIQSGALPIVEHPVHPCAGRVLDVNYGEQDRQHLAEVELAEIRSEAELGDASKARRVAELFELLNQDEEALTWWQYAAGLGDPDAVLYYQEKTSQH